MAEGGADSDGELEQAESEESEEVLSSLCLVLNECLLLWYKMKSLDGRVICFKL